MPILPYLFTLVLIILFIWVVPSAVTWLENAKRKRNEREKDTAYPGLREMEKYYELILAIDTKETTLLARELWLQHKENVKDLIHVMEKFPYNHNDIVILTQTVLPMAERVVISLEDVSTTGDFYNTCETSLEKINDIIRQAHTSIIKGTVQSIEMDVDMLRWLGEQLGLGESDVDRLAKLYE